jgi:hypothetical protein
MKRLSALFVIIFAFVAVLGAAEPVPGACRLPNQDQDRMALPTFDPCRGANVIVAPGTAYLIALNNPGDVDPNGPDFNDLRFEIHFGAQQPDGTVVATYIYHGQNTSPAVPFNVSINGKLYGRSDVVIYATGAGSARFRVGTKLQIFGHTALDGKLYDASSRDFGWAMRIK